MKQTDLYNKHFSKTNKKKTKTRKKPKKQNQNKNPVQKWIVIYPILSLLLRHSHQQTEKFS